MATTRGRTRRFTRSLRIAIVLDEGDRSALAGQQVKRNRMTSVTKPADLAQWAEDLVCPVCFAALHFSDVAVVCSGCERSYPVVDGIPVLIAERATLKDS